MWGATGNGHRRGSRQFTRRFEDSSSGMSYADRHRRRHFASFFSGASLKAPVIHHILHLVERCAHHLYFVEYFCHNLRPDDDLG
jgi:hypothetical protein